MCLPWYCPPGAYAAFLLTSKMVPLMATYVGRLGSVPESIPKCLIRYYLLMV